MGRKYFIETGEQTVSAAQDLVEFTVPSDAVVALHSVTITQSSDAGDSESEQLSMAIKRGIGATSGSGGSSVTPEKLETGDAASGVTAERNNTTQASAGGGSLSGLYTEDFNVMAGCNYVPTPECRPIFSPSETGVVAISAPGDALTMAAVIVVEEIGG